MTPKLSPDRRAAELNLLLDRIGSKLQLSTTAYSLAEDRYVTIGKFLRADGSLHRLKPWIYPQGSLRIGTTVKPKGRNEFDLDLVCLFLAHPGDFPNPTLLLEMVEQRFKGSETYRWMVERKNRCIRINYANDFHMDILPACPLPQAALHGEHAVVVPDCDADEWSHSNPKGYALWFESTAEEAVRHLKRNIEGLPAQQDYEDLATLKRVVQLLKRNRDVALMDIAERRRPISIVLTTLAATYYRGGTSASDAVLEILDGMLNAIANAGLNRLVVTNPTNANEDLSERWDADPGSYRIFVNWVTDFRSKWVELLGKSGIHNIKADLEDMFGERIAREIIDERMREIDAERRAGGLAVERGSGLIVPITVSSNNAAVRRNTFFGGGR